MASIKQHGDSVKKREECLKEAEKKRNSQDYYYKTVEGGFKKSSGVKEEKHEVGLLKCINRLNYGKQKRSDN